MNAQESEDLYRQEYMAWIEQGKKFENLGLIPGQAEISDGIQITVDNTPAYQAEIDRLTKDNLKLKTEVEVLDRLVNRLTSRNSYD